MCHSVILAVLIIVFIFDFPGGVFAYFGITTLCWGLFQTKYQARTLPRCGLTLDEAAISAYFDAYLRECDNNCNLLAGARDFIR